ncbi:unnamed protein product [Closterium sp. Naga37s-1]|nr:unnamed protein product [Closterium sp. Naga37s-1]
MADGGQDSRRVIPGASLGGLEISASMETFQLGSLSPGVDEATWKEGIAARRREEERRWQESQVRSAHNAGHTSERDRDPDWEAGSGEDGASEGFGGGGSAARGSRASKKRVRAGERLGSGLVRPTEGREGGVRVGSSGGSGRAPVASVPAAAVPAAAVPAADVPTALVRSVGVSRATIEAMTLIGRNLTGAELDPIVEKALKSKEYGLVRGMHGPLIWVRRYLDPAKPSELAFPDGGWGPDVPHRTKWPWEHADTWPSIPAGATGVGASGVTGDAAGGSRQATMSSFVTPRVGAQQLREGLVMLFAGLDMPFHVVDPMQQALKVEAVKEQLRRLRELASHIGWSVQRSQRFFDLQSRYATSQTASQQEAAQGATMSRVPAGLHLIIDSPTRWVSTLEMVLRGLDLRMPLTMFFDDTDMSRGLVGLLNGGHACMLKVLWGLEWARGVACMWNVLTVNDGHASMLKASIPCATREAWDKIRLFDAHWSALIELRDFLQPFLTVTLFVEGSLGATLQLDVERVKALVRGRLPRYQAAATVAAEARPGGEVTSAMRAVGHAAVVGAAARGAAGGGGGRDLEVELWAEMAAMEAKEGVQA